MARIRSIHPGLFTDESFVVLSCDAQVFLLGLWTEADDNGIFEWKPITLRMRLRPTKDGDPEALLSELQDANCIKKFSKDGRQFGAIRNFRRYQRPKSPKYTHPTPDDFGNYSGLTTTNSEIEGDEPEPIPQKVESVPQRKEEGGNRKETKPAGAGAVQTNSQKRNDYPEDFLRFWKEYPTTPNMSKKEAFKEWKKLSPEKREAAIAGLPGFKRYCEENKKWYHVIYADRFLKEEKFEGFEPETPPTQEEIDAAIDRRDKLFHRGKYAPGMEAA